MNRTVFFLPMLVSVIFFTSCGKHIYLMNEKELTSYRDAARESGTEPFVIYRNEQNSIDTFMGDYSSKNPKYSGPIDKKILIIGNKEVLRSNLIARQGSGDGSYQMFSGGFYGVPVSTRILKGKVSLYYGANIIHASKIGYSSFLISLDGIKLQGASYNLLKEIVKDCPAASSQLEVEFKNTVWVTARNQNTDINDYRALIRVLNIYNDCK